MKSVMTVSLSVKERALQFKRCEDDVSELYLCDGTLH